MINKKVYYCRMSFLVRPGWWKEVRLEGCVLVAQLRQSHSHLFVCLLSLPNARGLGANFIPRAVNAVPKLRFHQYRHALLSAIFTTL